MSYSKQYAKTAIKPKSCVPIKKLKFKYAILIAILILTLIGVTDSYNILRQALLPGDPNVTFNALQDFSNSVKAGESVSDSITAFCREIIENAQISD